MQTFISSSCPCWCQKMYFVTFSAVFSPFSHQERSGKGVIKEILHHWLILQYKISKTEPWKTYNIYLKYLKDQYFCCTWILFYLLTCRIITSVFQPLQTIYQNFKDFFTFCRNKVIQICKYSWKKKEYIHVICIFYIVKFQHFRLIFCQGVNVGGISHSDVMSFSDILRKYKRCIKVLLF